MLFYTFFLPKMVNLVIEDSSDFTFRDLMSLRGLIVGGGKGPPTAGR